MTSAPQVYLDHLAAITGPEPVGVRALWRPDGVLEFPYAGSLGSPRRLEGVEAIVEYFDGLGLFHSWAFTDFRAGSVGGASGSHVVEFHGSAIVSATSARYEQDYIVRFGLASDGLLQWMREYWDPTRL